MLWISIRISLTREVSFARYAQHEILLKNLEIPLLYQSQISPICTICLVKIWGNINVTVMPKVITVWKLTPISIDTSIPVRQVVNDYLRLKTASRTQALYVFPLRIRIVYWWYAKLTIIHQGLWQWENYSLALKRDANFDTQSSDISAEEIRK